MFHQPTMEQKTFQRRPLASDGNRRWPEGERLERLTIVGNHPDQDLSILKRSDRDVTDVGERFRLPGHRSGAHERAATDSSRLRLKDRGFGTN
jgi:hypothetical protein